METAPLSRSPSNSEREEKGKERREEDPDQKTITPSKREGKEKRMDMTGKKRKFSRKI